jgi:hypothetical protein
MVAGAAARHVRVFSRSKWTGPTTGKGHPFDTLHYVEEYHGCLTPSRGAYEEDEAQEAR